GGVCEARVETWETGIRKPKLAQVPIVQRVLDAGPVELSGHIGEQLKEYRRGRGITQDALAKRLQIDPSTLARWERGEREPTGRLAECVSVPLGKAKSASAA